MAIVRTVAAVLTKPRIQILDGIVVHVWSNLGLVLEPYWEKTSNPGNDACYGVENSLGVTYVLMRMFRLVSITENHC